MCHKHFVYFTLIIWQQIIHSIYCKSLKEYHFFIVKQKNRSQMNTYIQKHISCRKKLLFYNKFAFKCILLSFMKRKRIFLFFEKFH